MIHDPCPFKVCGGKYHDQNVNFKEYIIQHGDLRLHNLEGHDLFPQGIQFILLFLLLLHQVLKIINRYRGM